MTDLKGFRPIAKAIWPMRFRSYDSRMVLDWCEYVDISPDFLIQCVNEAFQMWNNAFPDKSQLIFAPEWVFNWGSQPEIEYMIPNWIRLRQGSLWGEGRANQNMSKYSNECIKGFIDFNGYNGPGIWTKTDTIHKLEVPKEVMLKWIFRHELGHIIGLPHVHGPENQKNIMHSGNRDIFPMTELGKKDMEMLKAQYPKEFGLEPQYKHIWKKLYWRVN